MFSFGINVFPFKSDDRYISVTFPLHFRYIFEMVVPAQHSKVVNHEILIRMSWFGEGLGVWHMWVNTGECG